LRPLSTRCLRHNKKEKNQIKSEKTKRKPNRKREIKKKIKNEKTKRKPK